MEPSALIDPPMPEEPIQFDALPDLDGPNQNDDFFEMGMMDPQPPNIGFLEDDIWELDKNQSIKSDFGQFSPKPEKELPDLKDEQDMMIDRRIEDMMYLEQPKNE